MKQTKILLLLCLISSCAWAQLYPASEAATWNTWLVDANTIAASIETPSPSQQETELQELIALARERDPERLAQADYWNTAAPSYRWIDILVEPYSKGPPNPAVGRAFALLNVAIYDTVVTTWKAKYREDVAALAASPASLNAELSLLPTSASPSFPSEHAAVATVAAEILAYLQPDLADSFRAKAEEAMNARLITGANFKSDIEAGKQIGMAVAEEIIAWAKLDGSDAAWEFSIPEGSRYKVESPVFPMTGSWKTWVLGNGQQFRVPPPPAYDSEQTLAEIAEIKAVERTFPNNYQAYYWGSFYAGYQIWYDLANKLLFEERQADNAPYTALIYSALGVAGYDAIVACFDSKYAYVYGRPSHVDPEITPLLPVPPHPSYPSAHSCGSNAMGYVLAQFFPQAAAKALQMAQDAGQSRILGGIHYQMDNQAGLDLGEKVAGVVLQKVNSITVPSQAEAVARAFIEARANWDAEAAVNLLSPRVDSYDIQGISSLDDYRDAFAYFKTVNWNWQPGVCNEVAESTEVACTAILSNDWTKALKLGSFAMVFYLDVADDKIVGIYPAWNQDYVQNALGVFRDFVYEQSPEDFEKIYPEASPVLPRGEEALALLRTYTDAFRAAHLVPH